MNRALGFKGKMGECRRLCSWLSVFAIAAPFLAASPGLAQSTVEKTAEIGAEARAEVMAMLPTMTDEDRAVMWNAMQDARAQLDQMRQEMASLGQDPAPPSVDGSESPEQARLRGVANRLRLHMRQMEDRGQVEDMAEMQRLIDERMGAWEAQLDAWEQLMTSGDPSP